MLDEPVEVEQAIVRVRETIMAGDDPELRYANIGADTLAGESGAPGSMGVTCSTQPGIGLVWPSFRRKQRLP